MNRRELLDHLRTHGCEFSRHGRRHDLWRRTATGVEAAVPRHRAVRPGTVRSICNRLDIPLPPGL